MQSSSSFVQIPLTLSSRFQTLFRLSKEPKTLKELEELSDEYIKKCVKESYLKAHFREIHKGRKIFGETSYETSHRITLPNGNSVFCSPRSWCFGRGFFLPIAIDDACFHCGKPIKIELFEGRVQAFFKTAVRGGMFKLQFKFSKFCWIPKINHKLFEILVAGFKPWKSGDITCNSLLFLLFLITCSPYQTARAARRYYPHVVSDKKGPMLILVVLWIYKQWQL